MTAGQSIAVCIRKTFVFSGRAGASEFWWFYALTQILRVVLIGLYPVASLVFSALVLPSILSAAFRRLNDSKMGQGWLIFPIAVAMTALSFFLPSELGQLYTDKFTLALFVGYWAVAITAFALLIRPSDPHPKPREVSQ